MQAIFIITADLGIVPFNVFKCADEDIISGDATFILIKTYFLVHWGGQWIDLYMRLGIQNNFKKKLNRLIFAPVAT